MSPTCIGWDTGAWNSDNNKKSRDALFAFDAIEDADPVRVGDQGGYRPRPAAPFRPSLTAAATPAFLLGLLGAPDLPGPYVVAIDAPLGLPAAFCELLAGNLQDLEVPANADQNPFTFRTIDRLLASAGIRPLSAVRDMLGSQTSKALYFLRKFGFVQVAPAVWAAGEWTVIETYPALVSQSAAAAGFVGNLLDRELPPGFAAARKNVYADKRDAAYCAYVGAKFCLERELLVGPHPQCIDAARAEGWIWYPSDTGVELVP